MQYFNPHHVGMLKSLNARVGGLIGQSEKIPYNVFSLLATKNIPMDTTDTRAQPWSINKPYTAL